MSKIDKVKEKISADKFYLGIIVATIFSISGYMSANHLKFTTFEYIVIGAGIAILFASFVIVAKKCTIKSIVWRICNGCRNNNSGSVFDI